MSFWTACLSFFLTPFFICLWLCNAKRDLSSLMDCEEDKVVRFLEWLELNGSQLNGSKIKLSGSGGFGLFCSTVSTRGILLVVPLRLAITPMAVLQDTLLGSEYRKLFEEGDVDDRFLMILFLLVERFRQNSFWSPYIGMLPSTFSTPLWFTDDELNELKGTALYHATSLQIENLKALFNDKVKVLAESLLFQTDKLHHEIQFEDFLWANSVFWTRALNIPLPQSFVFPSTLSQSDDISEMQELSSNDLESKPILETVEASQVYINGCTTSESSTIWVEGLVPGIDFCNHDPKGSASWEVDEGGLVTGIPHSMYLLVDSDGAFANDKEIRINYGDKGNEELLFLYGFVIQENSDDFLMVHYPRETLAQLDSGEKKIKLLEDQELQPRWILSRSLLIDRCSTEPMKCNKTLCQSGGYSWSGHRKLPSYMDHFIFPENMMAALRTIAMTEEDVYNVISLLNEISETRKQPSDLDVKGAIWEVCGNAGALQLLVDMLATKVTDLEEATGKVCNDIIPLENISNSTMLDNASYQHNFRKPEQRLQLTTNRQSAIVYRRGQKNLANLFLKEANYFLQLCLSEELDS